jgi:hypothetical protein
MQPAAAARGGLKPFQRGNTAIQIARGTPHTPAQRDPSRARAPARGAPQQRAAPPAAAGPPQRRSQAAQGTPAAPLKWASGRSPRRWAVGQIRGAIAAPGRNTASWALPPRGGRRWAPSHLHWHRRPPLDPPGERGRPQQGGRVRRSPQGPQLAVRGVRGAPGTPCTPAPAPAPDRRAPSPPPPPPPPAARAAAPRHRPRADHAPRRTSPPPPRRWVRQQAAGHSDQLWIDGARAYARYAQQLTVEYEDVLGAGGSGLGGLEDGGGIRVRGGRGGVGRTRRRCLQAAPGARPLTVVPPSTWRRTEDGPPEKQPALGFAGASSSGGSGFAFGGSAPAAGAGASKPAFAFGGAPAPAADAAPKANTGGFTFGAAAGGTPSSSGTPPAFGGGGGGTPATASPPMFAFGGGTQSTAGHTPAPPKFSFTMPSPSPSPAAGGGGAPAAAPAAGGFSFGTAANGGAAAGAPVAAGAAGC